jgi:hypothetical protein
MHCHTSADVGSIDGGGILGVTLAVAGITKMLCANDACGHWPCVSCWFGSGPVNLPFGLATYYRFLQLYFDPGFSQIFG